MAWGGGQSQGKTRPGGLSALMHFGLCPSQHTQKQFIIWPFAPRIQLPTRSLAQAASSGVRWMMDGRESVGHSGTVDTRDV